MQIRIILALTALSIGTLALGCGGNVDVGAGGGGEAGSTATGGTGGTGGSDTTTSTATTTTSGTTSGTGGSLPEGFCADACATLFGDGGCLNVTDCTSYCGEHASDWVPAIGDAFAKCTAEHPLCFETIEGCILQEMYPADAMHEVTLTGSGFSAYDGKPLHIWHDPDAGPQFGADQPLSGGQFSFEWTVPFQASDSGGPLLLLYIDVDGDGVCKPAADITHSVITEWNGDYLTPVFSATLTPPLNDADFVCSFTP